MSVRDKNHPRYGFLNRYMVLQNHKWRMRSRDTEAVVLTPKNAEALAYICAGTVITVDGVVMIRFQGLTKVEVITEGEYFIRTIMPGEEYYGRMSPEEFHRTYDRVPKKEKRNVG